MLYNLLLLVFKYMGYLKFLAYTYVKG